MESYFDEMADFERWANDQIMSWMETHAPTPEMVRIFAHLVADGTPWLYLLQGEAVPANFNPEPEWTLAECRQRLDLSMNALQAVIRRTDEAGLTTIVRSPGPRGTIIENTVAEILTGMFNHAEHHRGQILLLIGLETGDYVPSLYFNYLRRTTVPQAGT